jgi:hypothetical protein
MYNLPSAGVWAAEYDEPAAGVSLVKVEGVGASGKGPKRFTL